MIKPIGVCFVFIGILIALLALPIYNLYARVETLEYRLELLNESQGHLINSVGEILKLLESERRII